MDQRTIVEFEIGKKEDCSDSLRLRIFVESGVFVEILTTVSGLPFVHGVLSTSVPFDDADENQDQEQ